MPSPAKTRKDYEAEVRSWGFNKVFTWTDGPNYHYTPHRHDEVTTHLITHGDMTIAFPEDPKPTKTTYAVGQRIDVEARRLHEVWIGANGCTMVIGE